MSELRNPCTWQDEGVFENCTIKGLLICRDDSPFRRTFLIKHFLLRLTVFLLLIIISKVSSYWWITFIYLAGFVTNFGFLQTRFLCNHCPFYPSDGFFLKCNTLYGLPKFWRYRPDPISKWEMISQLILVALVDLLPVLALIYIGFLFISNDATLVDWLFFVVLSILILFQGFLFEEALPRDLGHRCPNFSCAMNKVPKEIRNTNIRNNPVMMIAWEVADYSL